VNVRWVSPRWRRLARSASPTAASVIARSETSDPYPSLQIVEAEVGRAELSSQQRTQSLDSKAGLS